MHHSYNTSLARRVAACGVARGSLQKNGTDTLYIPYVHMVQAVYKQRLRKRSLRLYYPLRSLDRQREAAARRDSRRDVAMCSHMGYLATNAV